MEIVHEEWRAVKDYEGSYEVSNLGNVRSLDRLAWHPAVGMKKYYGRVMKPRPHRRSGYLRITLSNDDEFYIHRLVMRAFVGELPEGQEVNHKNGNKADNRVENLEYCTRKRNMEHASKLGLVRSGDRCYNAKYADQKVRMAYNLVASGVSRNEAAAIAGIPAATVGDAIYGARAGYKRLPTLNPKTKRPTFRSQTKWTRESIGECVLLRRQGLSCLDISKATGIPVRTVRRHCSGVINSQLHAGA